MEPLQRDAYARDYDETLNEIHRHGVGPCGPPTVSWHIAVYRDDDGDNGSDAAPPRTSAQVRLLIRQFLSALRPASAAASYEFAGDDQDTLALGSEVVEVCWGGLPVVCRVAVHSDYLSITFLIDGSRVCQGHGTPQFEPAAQRDRQFKGHLVDLQRTTEEIVRLRTASEHQQSNRLHELLQCTDARAASEHLTRTIWVEFAAAFRLNEDSSPFRALTDHRTFADFRGVVLGAGRESECGWWRKSDMPQLPGTERFSNDASASAALDRLWPIFALPVGGDPGREFVACTMLDRRAVYLSPLGSRILQDAAGTNPEEGLQSKHEQHPAVVFAVLTVDAEPWQVGRLIHRINMAGTSRLLALRSLGDLRRAGADIRRQGKLLDQLYLQHLSGKKVDAHALNSWFTEYAKIEREIPGGGLAYRAARSHQLVLQFRALIEDLRVHRIETWEPYDQFVGRRLFDVYEHIRRLGERMDRMRNRASTLMELIRQGEVNQVQHEIKELHTVQYVVEFVAIAYYGGYVIVNAFGIKEAYWKQGAFACTTLVALCWALIYRGGTKRIMETFSQARVSTNSIALWIRSVRRKPSAND